uniref:Uncharacterized protein n=1 Tax=Triticum urartu TaxID=4572 RepID=A0A8R7P7C1_TRIUA
MHQRVWSRCTPRQHWMHAGSLD